MAAGFFEFRALGGLGMISAVLCKRWPRCATPPQARACAEQQIMFIQFIRLLERELPGSFKAML